MELKNGDPKFEISDVVIDRVMVNPDENIENIWPAFLSSASFLNTLSLITGVTMVGVSFFLQQRLLLHNSRWLAWILLLLGIGIFVSTVLAIEGGKPSLWERLLNRKWRYWLGIENWQIICLALSLLFSILATISAGTGGKMNQPFMAVSSWLAAILFAFFGGWQLTKRKRFFLEWSIATAVGFVVLAFIIRSINTTSIPQVLTGDEASSGLSAVAFIKGEMDNIFRTGWFSFPSLFFYIQSIPIKLLGQTIPALRLLAAFAGALTVGAVYLLAKAMYGRMTAILSALFLTAFHFHNHFSRIGLNNIWDGFWFVLALGFIWMGWQKSDRVYYLFSGLALGLAQYFYVTGRVLIIIVFLCLLVVGLLDRTKIRRALPNIILMSIVTMVTALPLAVYFIKFPEEFMAPLRRVGIIGPWLANEVSATGNPAWRVVLNQLSLSFQGFTHIPLRVWYRPDSPLLRPVSAALFVLGCVLLLLKLREKDSRSILILIWVITIGLVGGMSESAPAAQRMVAVAPVIAIVIGFGMVEILNLLIRLWPERVRLFQILIVSLLLWVALDDLRFYFLDYTPGKEFGGANNVIAQNVADYLQNKSSDWEVAFFGSPFMGYYSFSTIPYLAPHIKGIDMNYPWGSQLNPTITGEKVIFVFLSNHEADLQAVQASFPGGDLIEEKDNDGATFFWMYEYAGE